MAPKTPVADECPDQTVPSQSQAYRTAHKQRRKRRLKHRLRKKGTIERQQIRVTPSGLISRKDAAIFLGREPRTLAQWAWAGKGPEVININGRAYYRFEQIEGLVGLKQLPLLPGR